jgi:di/tricarboxylate transporter
MTTAVAQQSVLAFIFVAMLVAFVWGRRRFDAVAVIGLSAATAAGLVPPEAAFAGLGNPAVVTVAAVLIMTRALSAAGVFDRLIKPALTGVASPAAQLAVLCGLTAAASAFMNNIGALALFMPAALETARRGGRAPGFYLMSLSYAALLGGMVTLIGTPANMLISGFRAQAVGEGFSLSAFAPVGLPLAVLGVAYLAGRAWLRARSADVPRSDEPPPAGLYDVELAVSPGSPLIGRPAAAVGDYGRAEVYGVVRDERRVFARPGEAILQSGDILLTRADADALRALTAGGGVRAAAESDAAPGDTLTEVVVAPNALMQGSCAAALDLPERFGVTLIAAARQGRRAEGRLAELSLSLGDVLLLRGAPGRIAEAAAELGCLPLADRGLFIRPQNRLLTPVVFTVAVLVAAFELTSPAVAFVGGVVGLLAGGALRAEETYRAVDWPVIVLLAAMLPLGDALQTTGLAARLGEAALWSAGDGGPAALVGLILAAAMLLTPLLNNPATVAVMAPIALAVAARLGISPDPFLMAVAVGASCDFLTPFGHHNNALVMGPGGYRFGDYARLGWGLELLALAGGTGLITLVWL